MAGNESAPVGRLGPVVLFGSGETAPSGRKVYDQILSGLPQPPKIALLETPAGFELNSDRVIGRVADFLEHRLQNYNPQITIVPARKRGTDFSPDDPDLLAPLLEADMIFMGPGSPTYAVRQLRGSLAWEYLMARHRLGAAVVLASAAAIAVSAYALPVYEIYKVGEDLHWKRGLDFFGSFGMPLVFVPHWNNNDGGEELDTSRCFMGQPRFVELMKMIPPEQTVVGIDENTALVLDPQAGEARVVGLSGVTLLHTGHRHVRPGETASLESDDLAEIIERRGGHLHRYADGQRFPLNECCPLKLPQGEAGVSANVWEKALETEARTQAGPGIPGEVRSLAEQREAARRERDWAAADQLRERIAGLGWDVLDTPNGTEFQKR